jgi:hypothetical protein
MAHSRPLGPLDHVLCSLCLLQRVPKSRRPYPKLLSDGPAEDCCGCGRWTQDYAYVSGKLEDKRLSLSCKGTSGPHKGGRRR